MNKQVIVMMVVSIFAASGPALAQQHWTTHNIMVKTPAQQATWEKAQSLQKAAALELDAGNYAAVERDARQAIATGDDFDCAGILAFALVDEGKDSEALKIYGHMKGRRVPQDILPFALVLLKHGEWAHALEEYNRVLPFVGPGFWHGHRLLVEESAFTAEDPQPKDLEADIRVAIGSCGLTDGWWASHGHPERDVLQFKKALELEPDSQVANIAYAESLQDIGRRAESIALLQKLESKYTGEARDAAEDASGVEPANRRLHPTEE